MNIKFVKTHDYAQIPEYHSERAVGMDFHSCEEVHIQPWSFGFIPFGLKCEWETQPETWPGGLMDVELQIRARSSTPRKHLIIPHGVGTVDPDYRGELGVPIFNASNNPAWISIGERVAQGVLTPIVKLNIMEATDDELSDTARGSGGFGSTGSH